MTCTDNGFSRLFMYSKTCLKWPLSKRPKIGFQDQLYGIMQLISIAGCSTFIKLPFVIKIFVLSILSGCFRQVILNKNIKLEDLKVLRCSLDLNNCKTGQGQLQLIMKHILFYHIWGLQPFWSSNLINLTAQ